MKHGAAGRMVQWYRLEHACSLVREETAVAISGEVIDVVLLLPPANAGRTANCLVLNENHSAHKKAINTYYSPVS